MAPLLLGLTILFWGWQTGLWIFAVPFAAIVEASHWWRSRWDFEEEDFRNIFNFCLMLFLIVAVYLFINDRNLTSFYLIIKLQPILFFALVTTQIYARSDRVAPLSFFPFLQSNPNKSSRHQFPKAPPGTKQTFRVDLRIPYFGLCLAGASAGNTEGLGFYLAMAILVMALLWPQRSRRFHQGRWLISMGLALALGFGGQMVFKQAHDQFERQVINWISQYYLRDIDPLERQTAIGDVGQLKLSNQIAFRVEAQQDSLVPELLRQATYDHYQASTWINGNREFVEVEPITSQQWQLNPHAPNHSAHQITIHESLQTNQGLLKLPLGVTTVENLPVQTLQQNVLGAVNVIVGEPTTLAYGVTFDPQGEFEAAPTPDDLDLPFSEQEIINRIAQQQLKLDRFDPATVPDQLQRYFDQNYSYSLELNGGTPTMTPLGNFLVNTKSGHCEYFASATTLLLRSVGIPARYAVGFSVHEYSDLEQQYLVRDRHAHAWSLAYINGQWLTVDTTPADWRSQEEQNATSLFSGIGDGLAYLGFQWQQLWSTIKTLNWQDYWGLLMIPLVVILFRQLNWGKRVKKLNLNTTASNGQSPTFPGADSEFYDIEAYLSQQGLNRFPHETFTAWLDRLATIPNLTMGLTKLEEILSLHYRYRFDPMGLSTTERQQLATLTRSWLETHNQ